MNLECETGAFAPVFFFLSDRQSLASSQAMQRKYLLADRLDRFRRIS